MQVAHTDVSGESAEEVIRELGEFAVERGYCSAEYVTAAVDRESEFPTGLPVPGAAFGVAIPHADPGHAHEEAVVVGLPRGGVTFRSMDDPDRTVDAEAVLFLSTGESDGYATFLSNLATLFQEAAFADAVRSNDTQRVLDLVGDHCL